MRVSSERSPSPTLRNTLALRQRHCAPERTRGLLPRTLLVRAQASIYAASPIRSELKRSPTPDIPKGPYIDMENKRTIHPVRWGFGRRVYLDHRTDSHASQLICSTTTTLPALHHQTLHSPIFYHTEPAPQQKSPRFGRRVAVRSLCHKRKSKSRLRQRAGRWPYEFSRSPRSVKRRRRLLHWHWHSDY